MKKDSIEVFDEFENAMISKYSIQDYKMYIDLKKEKPTIGFKNKKFDYNLHLNFGVYNKSQDEKEISVFIDCSKENELKNSIPWLWTSNDFNKEYKLTKNISGKTDFHGKNFFKLLIKSNEKIFIANFPPKSYNKIRAEFTELSTKTKANKINIGKTTQGRDIIAYEYGDINNKPTILFVSGFHPPERDTIAIGAIMERFLDKQWRDKVLRNYSFSFIPILNPDGFANSMQGSNIKEINFHWKFFGNSMEDCPEAHNIWEYCMKLKPIVFFDFHAFTFQNNSPRPYLIPDGYYISKKGRAIQKYYNSSLSKLCGLGKNNSIRNEVILAPNLLATGLRDKFGTVTAPKFHLHMKDGIEKTKEMAVNCLDIILDGLKKYDIYSSDEILKIPYGKVKASIQDNLRIKRLNLWFFYMIPLIKKIMFKIKK
jgi:hypothetical protein